MGILSDLYQPLLAVLLRCDSFASDNALRAVFADARITSWQYKIPNAESPDERVRKVVDYLNRQTDEHGENALVLLLDVFREQMPFADARHQELVDLANALKQHSPFANIFSWDAVLDRYRKGVKELYGTTRILGKSEPVLLEDIYTDIDIFDTPITMRRFGVKARRINGLELIKRPEKLRLFIYGQPGAGKTTFLKYIALRAVEGGERLPVLVHFKEWNVSSIENLGDFIYHQFEVISGVSGIQLNVRRYLERGQIIVLMDGFDEISQTASFEGIIKRFKDFNAQYLTTQCFVACRAGGTEHIFENYTDVEIADFTIDQIKIFVGKWFKRDADKCGKFQQDILRYERLQQLGRTPLLLGLLCLAYEGTASTFSSRAEIYREAIETLLTTWNAARMIQQDEIYAQLSLEQKYQLFAHVALWMFDKNREEMPRIQLEHQILKYFHDLGFDSPYNIDAHAILQSIEVQHGILVRKTSRDYSFAHLAFQEYFIAWHVTENATQERLAELLNHCTNEHWREIILLVASLLDDAHDFFSLFLQTLTRLIQDNDVLVSFFTWITNKVDMIDSTDAPMLRIYYVYFLFSQEINRFSILRLARVAAEASRSGLTLELVRSHNDAFERVGAHRNVYNRAHTLYTTLGFIPALINEISSNTVSENLALDQVCSRDLDLALDHILAIAYDLVLAISLNLETISEFEPKLTRLLRLATMISKTLNQLPLYKMLKALRLPKSTLQKSWRSFGDKLRTIMREYRDVGHIWDFSKEQLIKLEQYLCAVELLIQCLNVAYVTDRAAIEDRLLVPPECEEK